VIKKYLFVSLLILALVITPVLGATSNDMTDPLTYLLKMLGQGKGSQGPQGEPGITTVISNMTGPAGPQGPQGVQGLPGTNGINGTSPSVMVNYTFTGDPGTNAGVTNIGSIWDVRLDFLIPAGAQGPQGIQGLTGITGPAGSQGPAGINGTDGATGATGPAGAKGDQGIQGIQGIPGNDGVQGPQGIPGINGTDGAPGAQGIQGIQGPAGINGTDGATGPQGIQGVKGDTGSQGSKGDTGAQGSKGDTGAQGEKGDKGDTGNTGATGPAGPMDSNVAFINGTRAFTGNLSMGSHYINNLLTGGLGSDAVNKTYVDSRPDSTYNASYLTSTYNATYDAKAGVTAWATWSPSTTYYTATPTGNTITSRWSQIGKIVYFTYQLDSTDSKGCTGMIIPLPTSQVNNGYVISVSGLEGYGAAGGTWKDPLSFVYNGAVNFVGFSAGTNGQPLYLRVSGFYEVA
jgi:hypothetical protein